MAEMQNKNGNKNPGWDVPVRWVLRRKNEGIEELSEALSIDRVAVRVMKNRGLETREQMETFLACDLSKTPEPALLPDGKKAAAILSEAFQRKAKIRIIGDYDVDGISASYVLYKSFSCLHPRGEEGVSVRIPDRLSDGYGLNERLIREAAQDGMDLLVTCDNGIAAAQEIALAKELGMQVIVTDHHEVPYSDAADGGEKKNQILPPADAVVDPKRADSLYPQKEICGAVVAMKLCMLLFDITPKDLARAAAGEKTDPAGRLFAELLEICGLATVCDVMDLTGENRTIVKWGLYLMEQTRNAGLRALLAEKELQGKKLSCFHMGFVIGPCLNASGRLDTAMLGFSLLCSKDPAEAAGLAGQLSKLNEERKDLTAAAVDAADRMLLEMQDPCSVIVVYLPDCHESIAGIVAGRIRERYMRPVFVVTDAEKEGMLKGSGRSVEAYHMYEGLHGVEDLLTQYGGHAMAAGFSLPKENLEAFTGRLNENCNLTVDDLADEIVVDADMPFSYISEQLIGDLERLEPFGKGNPRPVFGLRAVAVASPVSVLGKNRNVAKCILSDGKGGRIQAIRFGEADDFYHDANATGRLHILYEPQINEYNGTASLQVKITDYKIAERG
ncbi:MAG: single-stranded-DNA-specific exonuclease RecJ [Lachnospiraceae bacterium]|nr:single-stranded-DNA-specific exonuclease RecJ [Lachnospiraceae bacterium]